MMLKKKTKAICTIIALAVLLGAIALVGETTGTTSMLRTVLQMGAIYALLAVSMNLCNGMTGLFSLGQAGFMTLGAYVYGMLTIPPASRNQVYYLYGVADWLKNLEMPIPVAMILGGLVAALFAFLIGIPVLRLKSDYLAIATLGFAEVVRIVVASSPLNRVTNGSMGMTMIPGFKSYYGIFVVVIVCIALIALLMRSTYGRAFKAIRDDEIAAEAMGINLFHHKQMAFVISSFFAGVGGALLAMYQGSLQANAFKSSMTYEILLIVVIGGIGSVSGSVIGTFLYVACSEWWLRFLDRETYIGSFKVPLLRSGFRMVVFSVVIMIIVLFFSKGIMGEKELSWKGIGGLFQKRKKAAPAAEKED